MIQQLPYETLLQVYRDSIKYRLEQDFIDILREELDRREAAGEGSETREKVESDIAY